MVNLIKVYQFSNFWRFSLSQDFGIFRINAVVRDNVTSGFELITILNIVRSSCNSEDLMAISMRLRRLEIIRGMSCKLFLCDWSNWITVVKCCSTRHIRFRINFQRPVKNYSPNDLAETWQMKLWWPTTTAQKRWVESNYQHSVSGRPI